MVVSGGGLWRDEMLPEAEPSLDLGRKGLFRAQIFWCPVAPSSGKQSLSSTFRGQDSAPTCLLVSLSLCLFEWGFRRIGFPSRAFFEVPRSFSGAARSQPSAMWLGQSSPRCNNPGRQTGQSRDPPFKEEELKGLSGGNFGPKAGFQGEKFSESLCSMSESRGVWVAPLLPLLRGGRGISCGLGWCSVTSAFPPHPGIYRGACLELVGIFTASIRGNCCRFFSFLPPVPNWEKKSFPPLNSHSS